MLSIGDRPTSLSGLSGMGPILFLPKNSARNQKKRHVMERSDDTHASGAPTIMDQLAVDSSLLFSSPPMAG
ncbi:unnamed protein product [Cuscuta campestris]|uniref:Uncharacterized protein n=1 Tax=Cuscuta campestris TaxID=132261 RepID=A0A484NKS6_9ASTE|nr:unnamed protein product [Cuscuta campestris]